MIEWKVNLEFSEQGPDSPFWAEGFSMRLLQGLAGYQPVFMRLPSEPQMAIVLLSVEADDRTQAIALAEYLVNQIFDELRVSRVQAYLTSASTLEEMLEMVLNRQDFKAIAESLRSEGFDPEFPAEGGLI